MQDWTDPATRPVNEHGSKAQIGVGGNEYSSWRRTIGHGCYCSDVDWIEWRLVRGKMVPVALIETTFYDDIPAWRPKLPAYRAAALSRLKRDGQYHFIMHVAARLEIPAYFVLVRKDLAWFIACRLRDEVWGEMNEEQYRAWVMGLGVTTGIGVH